MHPLPVIVIDENLDVIRVALAVVHGRLGIYRTPVVTPATRAAERADVYANRDARGVPDIAPRLKYISWDTYAAIADVEGI